MNWELLFTKNALEEINFHKKSGDTILLKKLFKLLNELSEHPEIGTGQPEKLKYKYAGYWSRRINQKHRLIYRIENDTITVLILQAKGHYTEK
jgi:toxin YoeB